MKSSTLLLIAATLLFAVLANPIQLPAQEHTRYKLIDLGTFGGPQSYVNELAYYTAVLNNQGTVTGWADTPVSDPYPSYCFWDCFVSHAFQSWNGTITNLGVLPGGWSSAGDWISANGLIAGVSQNGEIDPLVSGFPELRAVLWQDGQITDLGTLPTGGYESWANAVNSHGVVVGLATNTTPDSNSMFGFGYQTRAFRWDENHGMEDLGTLGGSDAEANLVNDAGQIVGESYINSTPSAYCAQVGLPLTSGAFLWEHGQMKNLGSFGGTCTFATDLNNRGEVIGLSTLPGDQIQHAFLWKNGSLNELHNRLGGHKANAIALNDAGVAVGWAGLPGDQAQHASLWKKGSMTDLGTVDGDICSYAFSVNASEQVVGSSSLPCGLSQTRAFLWENGIMVDLNSLIPADSTLYLTSPETINDRGEIAGMGLDPYGNGHAFLLIPCGPDDGAWQDAAAGTAAPRVSPPPAIQGATIGKQGSPVRPLNQRRLGFGRRIGTLPQAGL